MLHLTKGDKAVLRYAVLWCFTKTLWLSELVGFFGILGTAGALECFTISWTHALVQCVLIAASMLFVGFLIIVFETVLPQVRRKTAKIVNAEESRKAPRTQNVHA